MGQLGEDAGLKLFREIAAANGFSVRKGHTLLTNLVAAGEAPLAHTEFNYTAEQLKKRGAPIDWFVIEPLVSMPNSIAVARMAPHPSAAVLMFDFMLSDAQKILADRDYVATSRKVAALHATPRLARERRQVCYASSRCSEENFGLHSSVMRP
jgi:iron(III) transport system substrate-binding protein